jgi:uncharacterized membrane protein YczE
VRFVTAVRQLGGWAAGRAWSCAGAVAEVLAKGVPRRAFALGTRVALLVGGSMIVAVAVATLLWNEFGPGPLDVFIGAVRNITGLPLMFAVWGTVGALTAVAWALGRRPGLGTMLMPLMVGPTMQIVLGQLQRFPAPTALVTKLVVHLTAVGAIGVGAGAVIVAGLGAGTGELLAAAASDRSGRPQPQVRLAFEVSWLTLGVLLGGPIGLGTILVALCIGPSIARGHRIVDSALTTSRRQLAAAHLYVAAR